MYVRNSELLIKSVTKIRLDGVLEVPGLFFRSGLFPPSPILIQRKGPNEWKENKQKIQFYLPRICYCFDKNILTCVALFQQRHC